MALSKDFDPEKHIDNKLSEDFDPEKYIDQKLSNYQPEETGLMRDVKDLGLGAAQGVTFGFADELAGGAEALKDIITGNTTPEESIWDVYRKRQKEYEDIDKAAAERSPWLHGIGEVGGGVLSAIGTGGISAAGKGAMTLGALAKEGAIQGAKYGAIQGAGKSEAGLENAGELVKDIGSGSLVGGAVGGILNPVTTKAGQAIGKYVDDSTLLRQMVVKPFQFGKKNVKGLEEFQPSSDKWFEKFNATHGDETTKPLFDKIMKVRKEAGEDIGDVVQTADKKLRFNLNDKEKQDAESIINVLKSDKFGHEFEASPEVLLEMKQIMQSPAFKEMSMLDNEFNYLQKYRNTLQDKYFDALKQENTDQASYFRKSIEQLEDNFNTKRDSILSKYQPEEIALFDRFNQLKQEQIKPFAILKNHLDGVKGYETLKPSDLQVIRKRLYEFYNNYHNSDDARSKSLAPFFKNLYDKFDDKMEEMIVSDTGVPVYKIAKDKYKDINDTMENLLQSFYPDFAKKKVFSEMASDDIRSEVAGALKGIYETGVSMGTHASDASARSYKFLEGLRKIQDKEKLPIAENMDLGDFAGTIRKTNINDTIGNIDDIAKGIKESSDKFQVAARMRGVDPHHGLKPPTSTSSAVQMAGMATGGGTAQALTMTTANKLGALSGWTEKQLYNKLGKNVDAVANTISNIPLLRHYSEPLKEAIRMGDKSRQNAYLFLIMQNKSARELLQGNED